MGTNSSISWTTHTYNPWQGCKKVSQGCRFCYMYRDMTRWQKDPETVVRSTRATFNKPLTWEKNAIWDAALDKKTSPTYVFTCSWSDFFIEQADEWRAEVWAIIKRTPHLTYQILTKRWNRIAQCLPSDWGEEGYPNVWIGISVEDQATWDERHVAMNTFPAVQKFFSFEPLLGPIHLHGPGSIERNIWAIIGGESGNETGPYRYRHCSETWILDLAQQCHHLGWTTFIKQMGTDIAKRHNYSDRHGGDITEWASFLQIREMP